MAMASGVLQLPQALSKCVISSGSNSAPTHCRVVSSTAAVVPSPSSSSPLSSLLWGNALLMKRNSTAPVSVKTPRTLAMGTFAPDDDYEETEEEIKAGYEALYGKAFGGASATKKFESVEDKDGDSEDVPFRSRGGRGADGDRQSLGRREDRGGRGARGEFEERVVQIRRVTKVVKGGKQLSFRAVVVVGDKKGKVGVGVNKAKEVIIAVQKAALNAKRNLITVPLNKYKTFPHRADGHYGAAHVMLRPASTGTGVIAGGAVRIMLEMAGVENALGKQIGSENPLNNARAVVEAISSMKTLREVSIDRGIPMEELWK